MELGWLRTAAQGHTYSYNQIKLKRTVQINSKKIKRKLSWGLDGRARWRNVKSKITIKLNWDVISNQFKKFWNKMELGLGWLRAAARCYNYNYNKIEMGHGFENNLDSWGLK